MKLVFTTGRAVATVARDLGVNEATLGRSVTAFERPIGVLRVLTSPPPGRQSRLSGSRAVKVVASQWLDQNFN